MARQLAPYAVRILPAIPEDRAVTETAQLYPSNCITCQILYRDIYHLRQQLTTREADGVALQERCRRIGVENDDLRRDAGRDAGRIERLLAGRDQNQRLLEEVIRRSGPVSDRVVRAIAVTELERAERVRLDRENTQLKDDLKRARERMAGDQRRFDGALQIAQDRSRRRNPRPTSLRRLEPRTTPLSQVQASDGLAQPPASA